MINKKGNIAVAISIVIAGLLIAATVIFTNKDVGGDTEDKLTLQLISYAEAAGVDKKDFKQCLEDSRYDENVATDFQNGIEIGGQGTPYSVILGPDNISIPLSGAYPIDNWKKVISSILENPQEILDSLPPEEENPTTKINPIDENDWIYGNKDAVIKIVEYSDTECPYCAKLHTTLKQVVDESDGSVAWVYRHLPLVQLHPIAPDVANATECAGALGGNDAFWSFINMAYEKADERK